jgi:soluble lytic murein transglycosylase-like protein
MRIPKLHYAIAALAAAAAVVLPATASFRTDRDLGAIVDRHAKAHGLPADFARAVVKVESTWNPQLTGAAGEVGLMQIKHETAQYMGFSGTRDQLYEPETNIRYGMKYLAGAWKLGGGDICQTVLRYQAGHGATKMTPASNAYCARVRQFMAEAS